MKTKIIFAGILTGILLLSVAATNSSNSHVDVSYKKPVRKSNIQCIIDIPEDIVVVDDDVVMARNRRRLSVVHEEEQPLSDYVKIRLALARMKALAAYQQQQT